MKVSLCGPHSFDTSTLLPTETELVGPDPGSEPLSRRNSYLLHQVGSWELFWAATFTGRFEMPRLRLIKAKTTSIDRRSLFFIKFSLGSDQNSAAHCKFSVIRGA